jgi:hypothetical protein
MRIRDAVSPLVEPENCTPPEGDEQNNALQPR